MFAANIGAIVGIQVLNKTSEEYWFLVKFNLSLLNGNMDLGNIKKEKAFFLIRLQIDLRLVIRYIEYRTLFLLTKRYWRQDQSKCSRSMNNTVGLLSNRRLKSNKRPSYDVMFVLNAPCRTESLDLAIDEWTRQLQFINSLDIFAKQVIYFGWVLQSSEHKCLSVPAYTPLLY